MKKKIAILIFMSFLALTGRTNTVYAWESDDMAEENVSEIEAQLPAFMEALKETAEDGLDASTATVADHVVITLDPGHDVKHAGSGGTYSGVLYREEILNLEIAKYVAEELKTYNYVDVYMTRESMDCPYPGTTSVNDNISRVQTAATLDSDYYIALHLNEGGAKGSEVYYQNANYAVSGVNPYVEKGRNISTEGYQLGAAILKRLEALGLSNRGCLIRNSETGGRYADGTRGDHFNIIRTSKICGISGIIVESCFLSSSYDRGLCLTTAAKKKVLGKTIAAGIADALGLSKTIKIQSEELAHPILKGTYSDGRAILTWKAVEKADCYKIYKMGTNGKWKLIAVTEALCYEDTTAASGEIAIYTARAVCSGVSGGYEKAGFRVVCVDVPAGLTASLGNNGPVIRWNKVGGAAYYDVYRKTAKTKWQKVGRVSGCSYTESSGVSGTQYTYTVRAVLAEGERSGYDTKGVACYYYEKPVLLSSSGNRTRGICLKWNSVNGAAQYRLYRKETGGKWKALLTGSATSYTDLSVEAGKTYSYTVRCLNNDGEAISGYDKNGKTISRVDEPELITCSVAAAGLTVKWKKVNYAESYTVFRRTKGDKWRKIGETTDGFYTETSGESGTVYEYTVRAVCKGSLSSYDTNGRGGLYIANPVLQAAAAEDHEITLSWSESAGAGAYRVFRMNDSGKWIAIKTTDGKMVTVSEPEDGNYRYTVRCMNAEMTSYISGYDLAGITVTVKNAEEKDTEESTEESTEEGTEENTEESTDESPEEIEGSRRDDSEPETEKGPETDPMQVD